MVYKESIDLASSMPTFKTEEIIETDKNDSTVHVKKEIVTPISFDEDGIMDNIEDLTGRNREPPLVNECESLKKCPSCSFPVPIKEKDKGCNRLFCFQINCKTEFCRYCKKIDYKDSYHLRCDCQK